jgi:hypothetical protein
LNIEYEVFKRASVNFDKLEKYGFKKKDNNYILEKQFINNSFKATITINNNGIVNGKIINYMTNKCIFLSINYNS